MSDYDIEKAAELAAQEWIRSRKISWLQPEQEGGPDRVYCGLENRESESEEGEDSSIIKLPCVICICYSAEPVLPNFHGNWNATLRLEIESNADDTTGHEHASRVREITRHFLTTTIAKDLSDAIAEFYVAKVAPGTRGWSIQGRSWVSFQEYTLISAAAIRVQA
jgi:hypothetical protein